MPCDGPPVVNLPKEDGQAELAAAGPPKAAAASAAAKVNHGGGDQSQQPGRIWRETKAKSTRRYKRLVFKNGECNISHYNIKKRKRRFLADIFTTLVDMKWRYTLLLFVVTFISGWLFFSLMWWLICFAHGDLDDKRPLGFVPCVINLDNFSDALLFSIETQQTIGYGYRYPTDRCPEAVLMVMTQSCFGVIIQALMTGLVFAKLSRPKKRAETLMFSKSAVICKRDGQMVLLFRVGDMRKSQLIEAHVRAVLIKKRITRENEVLPLEQFDIDLGYNDGYDRLFLVWPIIVEHKIDCNSPFWEISADDLQTEQFELIVMLEGIIESTGMTTQARSSYLPSEIRWGHRFERLITYQKDNGEYQINYEKFHATREIPRFPRCSARELVDFAGDEENSSAIGFISDEDCSSTRTTNAATAAAMAVSVSDDAAGGSVEPLPAMPLSASFQRPT
uniref:G protein-activated inward rectifier potassium channel 3 n=1 Tax=Macrostomum lignano TaxID=282301 RepID=A0A1I8G100_9PLAT